MSEGGRAVDIALRAMVAGAKAWGLRGGCAARGETEAGVKPGISAVTVIVRL